MKQIVEAAKVLEGELYPTASSVIPFIDAIFENLRQLSTKVKRGAARNYVDTLLTKLQSNRRFCDGYKLKIPYNCLTMLDPRYCDLYFNNAEKVKVVSSLCIDSVYEDIEDDVLPPVQAAPLVDQQQAQDDFTRRRAQLLAEKKAEDNPGSGQVVNPPTLRGKIEEEMTRFLQL